ncbi:unnamed protein product [Dicrocoelium dendriticum]|nr:unnamed protein product [Dicrocoelium dendriticum]
MMDLRHKCKYIRPVNFEEIQKLTEGCKARSRDFDTELAKLSKARARLKTVQLESNLANIWREEHRALRKEEIEATILIQDPLYKWIFANSEIAELTEELDADRQRFETELLKPIWTLRNDLKTWVECKKKNVQIMDESSIKKIVENMHGALKQLNSDLESQEFANSDSCESQKAFHINLKEIGIPEDAWLWETPSAELLAELLADFIHLDGIFHSKLEDVRAEFNALLLQGNNHWDSDELDKVDYFWNMFQQHAATKCKNLATIFLARLFEHRSADELDSLMELCERTKQLRNRACDVKRSWIRAREQLGLRIKTSLLEATKRTEQRQLKREQQKAQQEICHLLKHQVNRWRQHKAEILELEEQEHVKRAEEEKVLRREREKKRAAERHVIKTKLAAYKSFKAAERTRQKENEELRLALMRETHEKQAKIESARLLAAEKTRLYVMQQQRKLNEAQVKAAVLQNEQRLDRIRQKVRPIVKSSRARIRAETKSWKIKFQQRQDGDETTSAVSEGPLSFERLPHIPNTFTDKQLLSDRRTRLAAVLSSAGLLNTDYSRALLNSLQSAYQPRRYDQNSDQMREILQSVQKED